MLTNPNTLGLFETQHRRDRASSCTSAGALLYYDGANLNAHPRQSRGPGDMGFDVVHLNLHKTFSHAARRRRAGRGPGRRDDGARAVPAGAASSVKRERRHASRSTTTGRSPSARRAVLRQLRRPRARVRLHPARSAREGLQRRRRERRAQRQLPPGAARRRATTSPYDRPCMHEFVARRAPQAKARRARRSTSPRRCIDFGFHPPTVYFPLIVHEALMIEPTETESQGDARRLRRRDDED